MNKKSAIRNPQSLPDKWQTDAIRNGFTLIELLVVVAIIGMLAGILLPTLNRARERAGRAVCIGNLKVIGEAFHMYNIDRGWMPPTVTPVPSTDPYVATNQIKEGSPLSEIGLGYFYNDPDNPADPTTYRDNYIDDFEVYVCPASDYINNPKTVKSNWESDDNTYSAYIYRAESGYDSGEETLMLSNAKPAIVMDYDDADSNLYNHRGEYVNILFRNGYVKGVENKDDAGNPDMDGELTLGGGAADKDELFENADEEQ